MATFQFDVQYQHKVLCLMFQDFFFLGIASAKLQQSNFESKVMGWFFNRFRNYYMDYNLKPTKDVIKNEVTRARRKGHLGKKDMQEVKRIYRSLEVPVRDAQYVMDQVASFIRHQAIKQAMHLSIPLLAQEKYDDIWRIMDEARQQGTARFDPGVKYLTDYKARVVRSVEEREALPLGIPDVDRRTKGGGIFRKEMGIFLGPPNSGKSMGLIQAGKSGMMRRYKVAHFTFEMSADEIAERYDATIAGVRLADEDADLPKLYKRLKGLQRAYGHGIIIKEFPTKGATVDDIVVHLKMLEQQEGFDADLVLIDYGDIVKPPRRMSSKRFEIGEIFEEIRGKIAVEMNKFVWSAMQGNRSALGKKIVTMKDMSESIEPAKTADLILSLCQTEEEKSMDIMRLYFAKNRTNAAGFQVEVQTNFALAQLYAPYRNT